MLNDYTPSNPIYKRNFGQQKLMYPVNNSVQVHQFFLTKFSLINRTGESIKKIGKTVPKKKG